jgi:hypothetical protein
MAKYRAAVLVVAKAMTLPMMVMKKGQMMCNHRWSIRA